MKKQAMDTSLFIRLCGLFAFIAGILNVYLSFQNQPVGVSLPWYYRAADISVLITLIGIYFYQRNAAGNLGLFAILIIAVALIMLILNKYYSIAISIYTIGLILLAIVFIRAKTFPGWIAWLWILAPFIALPGYIFSFSTGLQTVLVRIGTISFGLGFMGIGYNLLKY